MLPTSSAARFLFLNTWDTTNIKQRPIAHTGAKYNCMTKQKHWHNSSKSPTFCASSAQFTSTMFSTFFRVFWDLPADPTCGRILLIETGGCTYWAWLERCCLWSGLPLAALGDAQFPRGFVRGLTMQVSTVDLFCLHPWTGAATPAQTQTVPVSWSFSFSCPPEGAWHPLHEQQSMN